MLSISTNLILILWSAVTIYALPTDYYLLALKSCDNTTYSIHGLWPQYNNGSWPQYCQLENLTWQDINPIKQEMETNWYSCEGTDFGFWEHEIKKHYSCLFNQTLTKTQYFSTTLYLFEEAKQDKYLGCQAPQKCEIPVNLNFTFINSKIN